MKAKKEVIKIKDLEKEGFIGPDASLEISLKEYGMAWREKDNEIEIIRHIENSDSFTIDTFNKDIDFKKEFNWIAPKTWKGFIMFTGHENYDDWRSNNSTGQCFYDLQLYFGITNIFGESYGFKIEGVI